MSAERSGRSRGTAWTVAVLVAVPLLYTVTYPFVVWGAYAIPKPPPTPRVPYWLEVYSIPWAWLGQTPLKEPLQHYLDSTLTRLPDPY